MQARAHQQRGEQRDDQRTGGDRQPGAPLQLGLALLGLRELELQGGVAIELAVDLEACAQRDDLPDPACLIGRGEAPRVFVEVGVGGSRVAQRRMGIRPQPVQRRHLARRHVGGAIRENVVERGQRARGVALRRDRSARAANASA